MIMAAVALGKKPIARADAGRSGGESVPLHWLFGDLSLDRCGDERKTRVGEEGL